MKSILVPTDFSPHARNACEYALALARDAGAKLYLLHAYSSRIPQAISQEPSCSAPQMSAPSSILVTDELRKSMDRLVDELRDKSNNEVDMEAILTQDEPTYAFKHYSQQINPDLLLFGVRHHSRAYRWVLGSLSAAMIDDVDKPVLVVPPNARYTGIKHGVYASDFDPSDGEAVAAMQKLLSPFDPMISFIHLIIELVEPYDKADLERLEKEILKHLREQTGNLNVNLDLIGGQNLMKNLDLYMDRKAVDLLAFTTHRRSIFFRLFYPSVTKEMMFITHKPMLVLHA